MAVRTIRLRRGLDIRLKGAAQSVIRERAAVRSVGLSGHDCPGIRPEFKVSPGQRVLAGETLFVDRKRPDIAFTAPAGGTVRSIDLGRRRAMDLLVIDIDGAEALVFERPDTDDADAIRALIMRSGLWPSFLARPLGRIADPASSPDAIFVTAVDTDPLAADPRIAIGLDRASFRLGTSILPLLTPGRVFVCTSPGSPVADDLGDRVMEVAFSGPHPSGLPGTHIHFLHPVRRASAWTIGYQDVIAIGHLLRTGRLPRDRVVAVTGPMVSRPSLVRAPLGASLDELLDGELVDGPARAISGSILSGREAAYLGRYHNQITVTVRDEEPERRGPIAVLHRFLSGKPDAAIIPREAFERAFPFDIPPVPLLRALSIGDVDTARELGCLDLVEEDLALLSHLCTTGTDYGALLRQVLDEVEARA